VMMEITIDTIGRFMKNLYTAGAYNVLLMSGFSAGPCGRYGLA